MQGKVYVAPLVEEIVSTPQDVMKLLSKGNESRKIGATDWVSRHASALTAERALFSVALRLYNRYRKPATGRRRRRRHPSQPAQLDRPGGVGEGSVGRRAARRGQTHQSEPARAARSHQQAYREETVRAVFHQRVAS
jgi:hypothetical protein